LCMTSYGGIIRIRSSFVIDEYSRVEVRLLPLSLQTQAPLYLFHLVLYIRFDENTIGFLKKTQSVKFQQDSMGYL